MANINGFTLQSVSLYDFSKCVFVSMLIVFKNFLNKDYNKKNLLHCEYLFGCLYLCHSLYYFKKKSLKNNKSEDCTL